MTGTGAGIDSEELTLYTYEEDVPDLTQGLVNSLKTTRISGTPNLNANSVEAGQKTVTYKQNISKIISREENYEVVGPNEYATGSWTATDIDEFNRVTQRSHYDGSGAFLYVTSTTYDCCNVASETDRYGIETVYTYDDLDRRITTTRQDVTTEQVYDALGRVVESKRYPEDQSEPAVVLSTATYDLTGRMSSQSRLAAASTETWAITKYTEEVLYGQDMSGDTVAMGMKETVEHPDDSITVTERAGDGTVLRNYGSVAKRGHSVSLVAKRGHSGLQKGVIPYLSI